MTPVLALVSGADFHQLLSGLGVSLRVTGLSLLVGLPLGVALALMIVSRDRKSVV